MALTPHKTDASQMSRRKEEEAHRTLIVAIHLFRKRHSTLLKSKVDLMTYYLSNPLEQLTSLVKAGSINYHRI